MKQKCKTKPVVKTKKPKSNAVIKTVKKVKRPKTIKF